MGENNKGKIIGKELSIRFKLLIDKILKEKVLEG